VIKNDFARALAALAAVALWAAAGASAQEAGASGEDPVSSGPRYSLAADAAAGLILAADGADSARADSAAAWTLQANLLHRIEAPGWGMMLSHNVDISGQAATQAQPAFAPSMTVYEAYARLDMGQWAQLFVGKRRMGLGIGSTFAPGDAVDPRSGFWDQKTGFRGIDLAASLGPDLAIRAALSLDRNFDAYALGVKNKAATGTPGQAAAKKAYADALGDAVGPADPRLLVYATSADAQLGSLQLAAAGVYSYGRIGRPSIGLSYDLGGLILQAEGAVELAGSPDWYGTAGARYSFVGGPRSLTVSVDYDYNGAPGLLRATHYLLPYLSYTKEDSFNAYARALVGLDGPSALVSAGLTLYPAQGFDLEFTLLAGLGASGSEFSTISSFAALPSPGTGELSAAAGLAARMHF
jgi:hypothetical protein